METKKQLIVPFIVLIAIMLLPVFIVIIGLHEKKEARQFNADDYQTTEHQAVITQVDKDGMLSTPYIQLRGVGRTTHAASHIKLSDIAPGDKAVYVKSKDGEDFAVIRIIYQK